MKRIRKKLNSQVGASITFALLLFLVCAVLCSVIIVAATASSGRMGGLVTSDQRYYAVTSAAELLKNVFKEHPTVSVVKVVETSYITEYTEDGPEDPQPDGTPTTKVYVVADKKASEIRDSDLDNNSEVGHEKFSINTIQKDAAKNIYDGTVLSERGMTLTSDFSKSTGLNFDALAVTIHEQLDSDGNITLTIYNAKNSKGESAAAGERYTLVLIFGADKSISTNKKTENVSSTVGENNTYTVKTKTPETTITTLTWTLNGIRTNS